MHGSLLYLLPAIGFAFAGAALLPIPVKGIWKYVRNVGTVGICMAVSYIIYRVLTIYHPFRGHPPFIAGAVFGAAALAGTVFLWNATRSRRIHPIWMLILSTLLLAVGGALHYANYHFYLGYYPTLHLAAAQTEMLILLGGIAGLKISFCHTRFVRLICILLAAVVFATGATGWQAEATSAVLPDFVDSTVLGQSRVVFNSFSETKSDKTIFDTAGPERFHRHSGLPDLPEGFMPEDYNILLIVSEATRFDQTSLFDDKLKTTPNLLSRSKNALVFTRAYAPSSGTLHSLSAILVMSYPSMIAMETWMKVWNGELYPEEETVAETLSKVGYDTFWVGYNHWFPKNLLGFDQGFAQVELIPGNYDPEIAAKAVEFIERRAKSPDRFFGWVFFVSPHGPYEAHGYKDMPDKKKIDRYRQEIRFVDEQLEKLFTALEERRILDKTIVIYTGDHGEEFREHGGTKHKTTVYSESIQVPLTIWIPGVTPGHFSDPTSTAYVFPWLFSHTELPLLKKRFETRAKTVFGPMLRETNGAIIVELIGHNKMRSSLIWKDLKVNYDFISNRVEVYRPELDRLEEHNLFGKDPALKKRARSMLEAYRTVRAAGARYILKPKKRPQK